MAWRDTLGRLREELADVRAERQRQAAADDAEIQQQREELSKLATSLGINQLLNEMKATLLNGQGELPSLDGFSEIPGGAFFQCLSRAEHRVFTRKHNDCSREVRLSQIGDQAQGVCSGRVEVGEN